MRIKHYYPKEEYVTKIFSINMSTNKMADVLYGYIMCKCRDMRSFGIGIYDYDRSQNSRNNVNFSISIHPDAIDRFKKLSNVDDLQDPKEIHLN